MYLGIDLGTSNSAVVVNSSEGLRLCKTSDGADVLPSMIYLDRRGHKFIGKSAQDRLSSAPKNVVSGFKRLMGTNSALKIGEQSWSPTQCSTEILKVLVSQAVSEMQEDRFEGAVITVPAAFNQMQSEATIQAARAAGLNKVNLLQEPVAAALAASAETGNQDGVFLIYDLGGGTFDLALVLSSAGANSIVAHEGINMLGGRDFDRAIIDNIVRPWLLSNFQLPTNFQAIEEFSDILKVCRQAVERAKIQLSTSDTASIFASEHEVRTKDLKGEEIYVSIEITRDDFVSLISDQLAESVKLCRNIIQDNGYSCEDIARIVPIGGPSKMPIVRSLLERELGIRVSSSLDPMTAVASGAAIFAESRDWGGEASTQKVSIKRGETNTPQTDGLSFKFDFKSRVSTKESKVRIKPSGYKDGNFELEVIDGDGITSGRIKIDGPITHTFNVSNVGENYVRIVVYDAEGGVVDALSQILTITRVQLSAASVPMTYTLAVKVQIGSVGYERNELAPILEKGTPLPASGKEKLRSGKKIVGGRANHIDFEFFDMSEGLRQPDHNLHIGNFRLDGEKHLNVGETFNRGDDLIIDWIMSDSGTLSFTVEIPRLGRIVDASDLYLATAGHVDYNGQGGAEIAEGMLATVESDLEALEEAVGPGSHDIDELRQKVERQHTFLSTANDADVHRSVSENARKLRQEIELLSRNPVNEEAVLSKSLAREEIAFDEIRSACLEVDVERHSKLVGDIRLALRERDFDRARQSLSEIESIRFKALFDDPSFLLVIFKDLAERINTAADIALHENLIQEGVKAVELNDFAALKAVIGALITNNNSVQNTDVAKIVELSHLIV